MMKGLSYLLRHHLKMELRSAHSISSLVLFALASVYTAFQVIKGEADPATWNAMAWIILMFTAFNSAARPMKEDLASVRAYLHWTVPPHVLIAARTLHQSLIMSALSSLVLFAMGLFLGSLDISSMLAFLLGLLITGVALACTLTLVSAISARAGAGYGLTAVLGLPLIIPIILVCTSFGTDIISGVPLADTFENIVFLFAISIGSATFGYILFPYLWRS
jgi:heme exporter protein B